MARNRELNKAVSIWFMVLVVMATSCSEDEITGDPAHRIVIETAAPANWMDQKVQGSFLKNNLELKYAALDQLAFKPEWQVTKAKVANGKAKWVIYSDKPVKMQCVPAIFNQVNPGDSINISYDHNNKAYSGKGSEKIKIWEAISNAKKQIDKPPKDNLRVASTHEYLQWDEYTAAKLKLQQQILDSCKNQLSQGEYDFMKAEVISYAVADRLNAFESLQSAFYKNKMTDLSESSFCTLWDSTQNREDAKWLVSQSTFDGPIYIINLYNEFEVHRKFNFDPKNDSMKSNLARIESYYTSAKQNYKDEVRERLMAYIIVQRVLYKMKPSEAFYQTMVTDYYNEPGFPEYKKWIKDLETGLKKKWAAK